MEQVSNFSIESTQSHAKMTDSAHKYDVFLSYEKEIEASILKLYDQLTNVHGLKCWIYVYSKRDQSLNSGNKDKLTFIIIGRSYQVL